MKAAAKRYLVGFVLVDGTSVVNTLSLPARSAADEAAQLEELHRRTLEVGRSLAPDHVAIWCNEGRRSSNAYRTACRAEGAVLAALGQGGHDPHEWTLSGLRKPAGLDSHGTAAQAQSALCARLDDSPAKDELCRAAAAAVATALARGLL